VKLKGNDNTPRFHYAGVSGSGMSALAQFQVMTGEKVSGSDRAFDRDEHDETRPKLEQLGITVYPQDGSGVKEDCKAVVVTSAVESTVPDYAKASELGIPIIHRSEILAGFVNKYRTVAVGGTSGKSTVVAMIFEILHRLEYHPSVITGGNLILLEEKGLPGNAWLGDSDILIVETDESDGSIIRYEPSIGVVLNLSKDHKEVDELEAMFMKFRSNTRDAFIVGEDENLGSIAEDAIVFGFGRHAVIRAEAVKISPTCSEFSIDDTLFKIPVPGTHNVKNALAAIAVCRTLGVEIPDMRQPLAQFRGVDRRFQSLGIVNGIEVVDDFAHNPEKIHAAISTAQLRANRVLAVFQPHGFSPTRFLRNELVAAFVGVLREEDRLWLPEIYYAGGTTKKDFSAADIVEEIVSHGKQAEFESSREVLSTKLAEEAREGDVILVMGARDPSLARFARGILAKLKLKNQIV
jgi:UDP-N-acetylmuramate--L-alanine ligase